MTELVFFLEEPSARAMLEGLVTRLGITLPPIRYVVFEGKQDLEKNLVRRLRGYLNPAARFIVVRDQDSAPDCVELKRRLVGLCEAAGRPDAIVRIFCRELETIYLADLIAVEAGLGLQGLARRQGERKFRAPDALGSPSMELRTLTKGAYQKIGGSRLIALHLDIANERSPSFRALLAAIRGSSAAALTP